MPARGRAAGHFPEQIKMKKQQKKKEMQKHTTVSLGLWSPSAHGLGVGGSLLYSALLRVIRTDIHPPECSSSKDLARVLKVQSWNLE